MGLLVAVGWGTFVFTSRQRARPGGGLPHSIAVLAFDDLSPNHDQGVLSEGLVEELNDALATAGWRVVPPTSAFWFKGKSVPVSQIGQDLNAGVIVSGSVRRQGARAKISVRLVKTYG